MRESGTEGGGAQTYLWTRQIGKLHGPAGVVSDPASCLGRAVGRKTGPAVHAEHRLRGERRPSRYETSTKGWAPRQPA